MHPWRLPPLAAMSGTGRRTDFINRTIHLGRGIKEVFLSKPCCRIAFKGNRFEEALAEGGARRRSPVLFSRWAASVQF
jgi:hypothetical protein